MMLRHHLAELGIAPTAKPLKAKRSQVGKPRALPKPIDDIDLPAGQRIICDWPPIALNPNRRVHYKRKSAIAARYHGDCRTLALAGKLKAPADGDILVRLDFFPPSRRRQDDDNAVAAFKHGRDGIAAAMKVDDSRFRVTSVWHVEPRNCVAVTILDVEAAHG